MKRTLLPIQSNDKDIRTEFISDWSSRAKGALLRFADSLRMRSTRTCRSAMGVAPRPMRVGYEGKQGVERRAMEALQKVLPPPGRTKSDYM